MVPTAKPSLRKGGQVALRERGIATFGPIPPILRDDEPSSSDGAGVESSSYARLDVQSTLS
jgi:hypothetical protein